MTEGAEDTYRLDIKIEDLVHAFKLIKDFLGSSSLEQVEVRVHLRPSALRLIVDKVGISWFRIDVPAYFLNTPRDTNHYPSYLSVFLSDLEFLATHATGQCTLAFGPARTLNALEAEFTTGPNNQPAHLTIPLTDTDALTSPPRNLTTD